MFQIPLRGGVVMSFRLQFSTLNITLRQLLFDSDTVHPGWAKDLLIRHAPQRLDGDCRLAQCSDMQMVLQHNVCINSRDQ